MDLFRGTTKKLDDNRFTVEGLLSLNEIGNLVDNGYEVHIKEESSKKFRAAAELTGFQNWAQYTKSRLKRKDRDSEFVVGNKYLTAEAIEEEIQDLSNNFPSLVDLISLPEKSLQGRTISALKIHGQSNSNSNDGVIFIAGVHSREIVNPDLLITLAFNLCNAYTTKSGLKIENALYEYSVIEKILNGLDIFIFPLVNPDGRIHVQNEDGEPRWRKNMNPNLNSTDQCSTEETEGIRSNKGVDLNRNYDHLWGSGIGSRGKTCSINYRGSKPFSEPESRNVKHMVNSFRNIKWLIDVHSMGEVILYPWGFDEDQSENPDMNFLNMEFDEKRGTLNDSYREYIRKDDLNIYVEIGNKISNAIKRVRNTEYRVVQSALTGVTSASSDDYCHSLSYIATNNRKIMSYTLETAKEFQPDFEEGSQVIKEVSAGLIELCQCLSR
jgi:murein tripeptide amidase MpaA